MDSIFNLDLPILIKAVGLLGVFFIVFAESGLFFGFFLPGDSLLFTAGLLASQGYFGITLLVLLSTLGAVLGDQVGYLFGKKVGPKIFTRDDSFYFKKKYIADAENFYQKYGKKTIILARFVPIIRTFVPILAGVGKMNYRTFFTFNIIGGVLWGLGIPLLGYFLGENIPNVDTYLIPILLFIIIASVTPTLFSFICSRIKGCTKP
jgi:membrane-associated protein